MTHAMWRGRYNQVLFSNQLILCVLSCFYLSHLQNENDETSSVNMLIMHVQFYFVVINVLLGVKLLMVDLVCCWMDLM